MIPAELQILLQKYFSGEATAEESRQAVAWLAEQHERAPALETLMDETWAAGSEKVLPLPESQQMLRMVFAGKGAQVLQPPVPVRRIRRLHWQQWMTAAAVLLLMGSLLLWYTGWQRSGGNRAAAAIHWQQLHNTGMHVKRVQLADGSQVWLMPQSTLWYPEMVETGSRTLRVEGEAYLEIAPDVARPLAVLAGGVVTRVLGTAFHIAAYSNEPLVYISLTRGKVSVSPEQEAKAAGSLQYLQPGQAFAWNKQSQRGTVHAIDTATVMACMKGNFIFQDLDLPDALHRVAARFGCTIQIDPALLPVLATKKVTGVFGEENAEEMIRNLLFVHGYHYRITQRSVTILP
jgi:ferric-dicitrate binding protein FerR (iron transport regulator)